MQPRHNLRSLSQVRAIRHAERETGRADLHVSRQSFYRAGEIQKNITNQRDAALVCWTKFLARGHFVPELSSSLAAAILDQEDQLKQACEMTTHAAQRVELAESACRMANLQYDIATDLNKQAFRHHRKCTQERDLNETADLLGITGKRYGN